jgi:hypothetical protein
VKHGHRDHRLGTGRVWRGAVSAELLGHGTLTPPPLFSNLTRGMNQLYFGDNLNVLRETIASESVDLIYLDPPFNSKRDYNLLFKSPPKVGMDRRAVPAGASPVLASGLSQPPAKDREARAGTAQRAVPTTDYSSAQITAFEDSWHWGEQAEREFDEIIHGANTDLAQMMNALRSFLGANDMMAYLTMMANRLPHAGESGMRLRNVY